ncbi:MAG: ATP-binding protein [Saprospiraceae bacterium]|nr:ATP-binding protein [Saprospiraceae bacterium]
MFRISSHPHSIRHLDTFVARLVEEHQLSEEKHGNILISLSEAVNNAIIHGNRSDIHKKVVVHAERVNGSLAIVVEDEGCGFDFRKLPDPTKDENVTKIGGRGVFLMHNLCDSVRFHRNGCKVELEFHL